MRIAIKTFLNKDQEKLDKQVNAFIHSKGVTSLPVRTETYIIPFSDYSEVCHKAVVFYNEPVPKQQGGKRT